MWSTAFVKCSKITDVSHVIYIGYHIDTDEFLCIDRIKIRHYIFLMKLLAWHCTNMGRMTAIMTEWRNCYTHARLSKKPVFLKNSVQISWWWNCMSVPSRCFRMLLTTVIHTTNKSLNGPDIFVRCAMQLKMVTSGGNERVFVSGVSLRKAYIQYQIAIIFSIDRAQLV